MKRSLKRLGKFIPYAIIALLLLKSDGLKFFTHPAITIISAAVIIGCFFCIGYLWMKQKKEAAKDKNKKNKKAKKKAEQKTGKGRKK